LRSRIDIGGECRQNPGMGETTMVTDRDADRTLAVLKIVWMSLLGSLAVYVVVGRLVAPGLTLPVDAKTFATLRTVLYALGLVTLGGAGYVRRLLLAQGSPSATPAQKYSGAVTASMAMSESIGVYGLVLFLLGRNDVDLYLPAMVAAAARFYFRPRREELQALAARGRADPS
jgi:hypothetical protein